MAFRQIHDATIAAGKCGFSRASGYRIEDDPRLPSQKKAPRGRRTQKHGSFDIDQHIACRNCSRLNEYDRPKVL